MSVEWIDTDEGAIAQVSRDVLQALIDDRKTSEGLRIKLNDLLANARYDIVWVYPDGETDREFARRVAKFEEAE